MGQDTRFWTEPEPLRLKLWLVVECARWGQGFHAVRAESALDAVRVVTGKPPRAEDVCVVLPEGLPQGRPQPKYEITELSPEGKPATLWCYETSPDTGDT